MLIRRLATGKKFHPLYERLAFLVAFSCPLNTIVVPRGFRDALNWAHVIAEKRQALGRLCVRSLEKFLMNGVMKFCARNEMLKLVLYSPSKLTHFDRYFARDSDDYAGQYPRRQEAVQWDLLRHF